MRKLFVTIGVVVIIGSGIAAHSANDPSLERPSWVRPDGTEIKGLVPKWVPVLGHQGQVIGFTHSGDNDRQVFSVPGGRPIGTMGASGFKAAR